MAHIIFYTKPGCKGGMGQKKLLISSGHTVEERSILDAAWTPETLKPYFAGLDVKEWYNKNAPEVKAGKVVPGDLPEEAALALFCTKPILIKRPLMIINDEFIVGFDTTFLDEHIGLKDIPTEDLTICQALTNLCETPI